MSARIYGETITNVDELRAFTKIGFSDWIRIGQLDDRGVPNKIHLIPDAKGLYTIWVAAPKCIPILVYGGMSISKAGIQGRIRSEFLHSRYESGVKHVLEYLKQHDIIGTWYVCIAPIRCASLVPKKETKMLSQIDFIANTVKNGRRRIHELQKCITA